MTQKRLLPLGALLAPLLLLPACIYSSQVKADKFKLPGSFGDKTASQTQAKPVGRWWQAFGNGELDRLVQIAFAESPDLEVARARIEAAGARLGGASAGWYPSLAVSGNMSRQRQVFNFGGNPITFSQNSINLSLNASWEIDLWGKVRYARRAAQHNLRATHEELRAGYVSIAAGLTDAYYLAVQQRALIKLLDATIKSRESQVDLVRRRYQSGVSRADDLYQALQNLASAKAAREQSRGALRSAEIALAALVGRYPGQIDAGKLDKLPEKLFDLGAGVPAQLLKQRPDLRAAFQRLKAADQSVGAAFAAHFPTLNIGGSLGYVFQPGSGVIWSIFAGLTAPLFQGGAIDARYKESRAILREAVANFKKTLLNAVREVADAVARGEAIAARIKHINDRVTAAEGALRLSSDQYAQGLTLYLNVLLAEQALLGARTDLINARRELVSARVTLARALGGSWMDETIKQQNERERAKKKSKQARANETSKTATAPQADAPRISRR